MRERRGSALLLAHFTSGERRVIAQHVYVARGIRDTSRGLLGIEAFPLPDLDALVLIPCPQVHTRHMAFPIDVLMLAPSGRVLRRFGAVPPGKSLRFVVGATWAAELPAGTTADIPLRLELMPQ